MIFIGLPSSWALGVYQLSLFLQGSAWEWNSHVHKALTQKVVNAVDMIHKAGVLHGDLHKRNILVTPSSQIFILDFDGSELRASHELLLAEKAHMIDLLSHMVRKTMAMLDKAAYFIVCKPAQMNVSLNMPICRAESAWQPSVILALSIKCNAAFCAGQRALREDKPLQI